MNSKLYDKKYPIPEQILKKIRIAYMVHPNSDEGAQRAKNLLDLRYATYQGLKRIKHDIENSSDEIGKALSGGEDMLKWINITLNNDRDSIKRSQSDKSEFNPNLMNGSKTQSVSINLHETELILNKLQSNAIAIIFNTVGQILLLKRQILDGLWGSGKWALVGGKIEDNETPRDAVIRECFEETSLDISNLAESYFLQKDGNREYFFIVCYEGKNDDVNLNKEHTAYMWVSLEELMFIDLVPGVEEQIKLALKLNQV